ncbi:MAG: citrate lyase holo-[Muribaculaceae bacterium]|nr:citrate lyase holo-[acyl-carrier protein] synthase [Muribaculaceae bacterium]
MEITLDALLQSRDNRHALQQQLLKQHPGGTLVCLTVVMPGSVKRNLYSMVTAQAAMTALLDRLGESIIQSVRTRDLMTGYEAYLITGLPAMEAKRVTTAIEDSHPLGRLFDIDVIDSDGTPISRQAVGGEPRRCLLCDHEARWCMRNHSHTQEELLAHIQKMINDYVR